jgi:hypothetical protein
VAAAAAYPRIGWGYVCARWALHRGYDTSGLPLTDLMNAREPLNLVFTSSAFQPGANAFDASYRFVGASVSSRLTDPEFDAVQLKDPVLYASLGTGTVFDGGLPCCGPSGLRWRRWVAPLSSRLGTRNRQT